MNIIVLTPDRVGSTLLQKFLTMTMQNYNYDKPVINLHELTNGLISYHSSTYNQTILGKPKKEAWGYHQTLEEVVTLLSSADHYKVSRLAQYHMLNRKDSLQDQLSLYKYINDNFFIISARRENLFEHALSWCIVAFTKHLNIYTHEDKIDVFNKLYKRQITIDQEIFKNYLDKYLIYLKWVDDHFIVNSIFNYDKHLSNLESYVNNLDIFPEGRQIKTWKEFYGISWNTWNKCHYTISDMSGFSSIEYHQSQKLLTSSLNTDLPTNSMTLTEITTRSSIGFAQREMLKKNIPAYHEVYKNIDTMVQNGTLVNGMPIKLQTLAEKAMLVKNFKECLDTYNNWSSKNKLGFQLSLENLGEIALSELKNWYETDESRPS
jgi:hypothetical protein